MVPALPLLLTAGHGTSSQADFLHLLGAGDVAALVDVRIGPGSRNHPHFTKDRMETWLPAAGINYRWEKRLGGFRRLPPGSPDTALRNESFRAYASHMRTAEFGAAITELLSEAAERRTVIMCSETVWWRCHRRLIADHCTLLHGLDVQHLMPPAKLAPHQPTAGVRVHAGALFYDDARDTAVGT
jgi:uncharacterized protein (DUF488 family)